MVDSISKTKFIPPQAGNCWWRDELWEQYLQMEEYQGILIKAPSCYGKSITTANFFKKKPDYDFSWYKIEESDTDLLSFFRNLFQAANKITKEDIIPPPEQLTEANLLSQMNKLINQLLNYADEHLFLVLDNYQLLRNCRSINNYLAKLLKKMPPSLHLIIISRGQAEVDHWIEFRLKQKVMIINRRHLSLNQKQIVNYLADEYDLNLTKQQAEKIYQATEGWVIGLDYIGQQLSSGHRLEQLFPVNKENFPLLFNFFELEVLTNLAPEIKKFILKTAFLPELKADLCNKLVKINNAQQILKKLYQQGLFIFKVGEGKYRYHSLLRQVASYLGQQKFDYQQLKQQIVDYYLQQDDIQKAINYSLESENYQQAAQLIISSGQNLLEYGRLDALQTSLTQIPGDVFQDYPELFIFKGDIYRLKSKFQKAETNYQQAAEIFSETENKLNLTKALERTALVYLDTAQPDESDYYLQQALQIREEEDLWQEADFLKMLAETKADKGNLAEALELKSKLEEVIDKEAGLDNNLNSRVQLRTGQLERAEQTLINKLETETINQRTHNSYRETMLVLSLIKSFKGEPQAAKKYAEQGIKIGKQFNASFVEAVGYMRLGHAYQLLEEENSKLETSFISKARETYFKAIDMVNELDIKRGKAEPLMGLAFLEGFYGNRELGVEYAEEGIDICKEAGDLWLAGMLRIALGVNYYFNSDLEEAEKNFLQAKNKFDYTQDSFGKAVCELWFALILYHQENEGLFEDSIQQLFELVEENEYQHLYSKPTFLGARDPNLFAPIWLEAKQQKIKEKKIAVVNSRLGIEKTENHPGYSLRIKTLGDFKLWRGREPVASSEWSRKKAKELFQLFIIHKGELLLKDRIYFFLWPDKNEKKAKRNFKVTLNCLKKVLEPDRKPRQTPFFIKRRNSAYGLDSNSSYLLDTERFEKLIRQGDEAEVVSQKIDHYEAALALYTGDFLPESLYNDWIRKERVRLKNLFLNTADKLIEHYYEQGRLKECIDKCDQILTADECWENAYYYKMKSYNQLNNRAMAVKIYDQCRETLNNKLDLTPTSEMKKLYQSIT